MFVVLSCTSCADFTDYPDDGLYLSEYPYFYYKRDHVNGSTAEIDYNGQRIKVEVDMTGGGFDINSIADIKQDESGEPYLNLEDIFVRGTWSMNQEGDIVLEIDNGNRIVLKRVISDR